MIFASEAASILAASTFAFSPRCAPVSTRPSNEVCLLHLLTAGYGTSRTSHDVCFCAATGGQADIKRVGRAARFMSTRGGASMNGFLRGVFRDASPVAAGV